jgi:hypothetical protein
MNSKHASQCGGQERGSNTGFSISSISAFIKNSGRQISNPTAFTIIALVLVALSSFALGRLSVLEQNREPIRIEYADQMATSTADEESIPIQTPPVGGVVASKTGSVYYFPWCIGATKISESNKVWYATEELARTAGLRAGNCKGMGK